MIRNRILPILLGLVVIPLLAESNGRTYLLGDEGGAVFVRVPSTRSKERMTRTSPLDLGDGCGTFGHACFGGYGKRAQTPIYDDRDHVASLDRTDDKTIQIFRQMCMLPPNQQYRLAPIFRRLVDIYDTAAEDQMTRK